MLQCVCVCVCVCLERDLYLCLAGRAANCSRAMPEILRLSKASGLETNVLPSRVLTSRPRDPGIGEKQIVFLCMCECGGGLTRVVGTREKVLKHGNDLHTSHDLHVPVM